MDPMVDLHLHTTASDGLHSPSEVVAMCKRLGFSTIAITDHDTMCGVSEGMAAARGLGMVCVPGVEINAGGCPETHMLGYGVDREQPAMQALFQRMRRARVRRVERFLENLAGIGIHIDYDEIIADAGSEKSIGRPHIGHALVAHGYASDLSEAFGKYLAKSAKTYAPREKVCLTEAISTINKAGGVAVLAHPALLHYDLRTVENTLIYCKKLGLGGVECYHSRHDRETAGNYRRLAIKYDLLVTGGSDFHGGLPSRNLPPPSPGDGLKHFTDGDRCAALLIDEIERRRAALGMAPMF